MKVMLIRERFLESLFKDFLTFGCLFLGWALNHLYWNGAWSVDFIIFFMVIMSIVTLCRHDFTVQEAKDVLKELD